MTWLRPMLLVFMPFAAGYYLSYLFRVINAVVAAPLVDDLGLDATRLGLLSSVYFLTFAAVQLPLGAALDRFGPRRVQGILIMLAAVGAVTFARASTATRAAQWRLHCPRCRRCRYGHGASGVDVGLARLAAALSAAWRRHSRGVAANSAAGPRAA